MKEKIFSPDSLLRELKKWNLNNKAAEQLDGSLKAKNNPRVFCFISIGGAIYRLHQDTKKSAVNRFIFKSEELGSPFLALRIERTKNGKHCLRLNDGNFKSKGWYCYLDSQASKAMAPSHNRAKVA